MNAIRLIIFYVILGLTLNVYWCVVWTSNNKVFRTGTDAMSYLCKWVVADTRTAGPEVWDSREGGTTRSFCYSSHLLPQGFTRPFARHLRLLLLLQCSHPVPAPPSFLPGQHPCKPVFGSSTPDPLPSSRTRPRPSCGVPPDTTTPPLASQTRVLGVETHTT